MSEPVHLGAFSFSGSAPVVEALARSGLDWVCLDAQHGRWSDLSVLGALDLLGGGARQDAARVYVRPRSADHDLIGRALDAGAAGVIVPMIDSVEQTRAVTQAARFPPIGTRSFGPIRAAFGAADDLAAANAGVTIGIMIETSAALAAVDDIARVDGVDMLFVGPFDLALALDTTVDALLAHTSADAPIPRIAAAARAAEIRFGGFAGTTERARAFIRHGATFVSVISDLDATVAGAMSARRDALRTEVS